MDDLMHRHMLNPTFAPFLYQIEFQVDPICKSSILYTIVNNLTQGRQFDTNPYVALKVCKL